MINLKTKVGEKDLPTRQQIDHEFFFQLQINRIIVGGMRYGEPRARQKYLTRLKKELKAYVENGNAEQLLNIANFAMLEFYKPENTKFHFDPSADSVTRGEM